MSGCACRECWNRADQPSSPTEEGELKERQRDAARQRGCGRPHAREAEEGYIAHVNSRLQYSSTWLITSSTYPAEERKAAEAKK